MRQQILQAAQEVLRTHGLEQLSLRLIAEQLDVTAATLYRYFDSKDAIVTTLVGEARQRLRETMEQVPADLPPGNRLVSLGLSYLEYAKAYPALFQLAFLDVPSDRSSLATPAQESSPYRLLLQAVEDAVRVGIFRPEVREVPEVLAYSIWALAHGMAVLEATHLREFQADFGAGHRMALRLLIEGMIKR